MSKCIDAEELLKWIDNVLIRYDMWANTKIKLQYTINKSQYSAVREVKEKVLKWSRRRTRNEVQKKTCNS